ncbi:LysR family transcriptional regulator [Patulibacter sp. SYSU D01012]|uniref:LysR family transcriptional regulator n=1 Tax=Patulibacter sp. SYSU D01012 TaxID=2817381 RepID=UPI001B316D5C|nr:LysR family transcriptional regulator [Patulibacter sp. SYSU D01012]
MDPLHLRVLREVARRGTIAAAADALGYTPPAVSRHLSLLERDAGRALLERTPRGARLTDAGVALLAHAERILEQIEAARAEMALLSAPVEETVRVAAFRGAILTYVPQAARELRRGGDDVDVAFEVCDAGPAADLVRRGGASIAVLNRAALPLDVADLDVRPLLEDEVVCVLPADHPLAGEERIPLERLADETWILGDRPGCPMDALFLRACRREGFAPDRRYVADDNEVGLGLVAASRALSIAPRLSVADPPPGFDVVRRPFARPLPIQVVSVTHVRAPSTPARTRVRAALHAAADRYAADRPPVPAAGGADERAVVAAAPGVGAAVAPVAAVAA